MSRWQSRRSRLDEGTMARSVPFVDDMSATKALDDDMAATKRFDADSLAKTRCLDDCAICLEPFGTSRRRCAAEPLPCGHCFCVGCSETTFIKHKISACPLCRAPVKLTTVVPAELFLSMEPSTAGRFRSDDDSLSDLVELVYSRGRGEYPDPLGLSEPARQGAPASRSQPLVGERAGDLARLRGLQPWLMLHQAGLTPSVRSR